MTRNVGTTEGIWRAALGGLALAVGLARASGALLGVGAIALVTAFSGYCPANALLGIDTARGAEGLPGGEQGRLAAEATSAAG